MKFTIIGGGITGLYIGYLLKLANIDFVIYEKSDILGGKITNKKIFNNYIKYQIYPHNKHILELLVKLDIPIQPTQLITKQSNINKELFNKIKQLYDTNPISNIITNDYLQNILSDTEYNYMIDLLSDTHLEQYEISTYMKYHHMQLISNSEAEYQYDIDYTLIEKLFTEIKDNIYTNHEVQEITHMPLTNNYLLKINDNLLNVDKLILTTNFNIKLNINSNIINQFTKIKSYNYYKYIIQTNNKLFYPNYTLKQNSKNIISNFESNINYRYIRWNNAYHVNQSIINYDFYIDYGLILAIHPYLNNLEGSCLAALNTLSIIQKNIYSKRSEYLYKY